MRYLKCFILALVLCSSAFGVNDFSSDSTCKAVWNMDNGAGPLLADSKGTNTLTNFSVTADTGVFKEGDASSLMNALTDSLEITDAALDSGFPLKSGESNRDFTILGWINCNGFPVSASRAIWGKFASGKYSVYVYFSKSGNWRVSFARGTGGGITTENVHHASTVVINVWYHVAVSHLDSTNAYRIRIWDDNAGAILGSDLTGNFLSTFSITTEQWAIGSSVSLSGGGYRDEVVVFDRVLSVEEIDAIRAGTFPVTSTIDQLIIISKDFWSNFLQDGIDGKWKFEKVA